MEESASSANSTTGSEVQGLRYLKLIGQLLDRLHPVGCQRDRAGNRRLFFDNVCSLVLLTFFNSTIETLGDVSRASKLEKMRQKLGCDPASITSLSEAMRYFDAEQLAQIIQELLAQIPKSPHADPRLKQLVQNPVAVDGSLLKHMPQITQACYQYRRDRGWKLHAHFEILRGTPVVARITDGSGEGAANEKAVLRATLQPDCTYVMDRGYEEFALFNAIASAGSSYVCRVRNDHHFTPDQTQPARELSDEAREAGIASDEVGWMGSPKSKRIEHPDHLQRRVVVQVTPHPKRGGRRRNAASQEIVLVTNLLDVPAEVIALLYRYRWLVELFFRWLKCVLSCRHLLSRNENGIQIQVYCAIIACLLIQLAAGNAKPTKWTYKLLCLYHDGLASEQEVMDHLRELAEKQEAAKKSA